MAERLGKLFFLLTTVVLLGCNPDAKNEFTYFGGKIINPKAKYVVLFENEHALDTFYLHDNHTFFGQIPLKREGLYYFKHGPEHQYLYLKPKDSLLIRLNTWDFDESLVFSGNGSVRNNILIDCFLDTEADREKFYSFYDLDAPEFKTKIDSTEKRKLARYDEYVSNNPEESEGYKNILKIALTYPVYSKAENYSMSHNAKRHDTDHDHEVHKDFYSYRDKINLKQDSVIYFYAYRDLIVSHMYNRVNSNGHEVYSDKFTVELLNLISKEMKHERTKNALLRQTVIGHFYRRSSCSVNEDAFETYLTLSTNNEDKYLISNLLNDTKKIHKGKKIKNFYVTDYNKSNKSIKSIIKNKSAVVYFWNPDFVSKDYIASKIGYLSKKYPSVKFVGVKIDGNGKDRIKKLDIKSQYFLTKENKANYFLTSKMPRTLLINRKGVVTNAYASLSSSKIYKQIDELVKK